MSGHSRRREVVDLGVLLPSSSGAPHPGSSGIRLGVEVFAPAPPCYHYRRCVVTGVQASLGTVSLLLAGEESLSESFTAPLAAVAPIPPHLRSVASASGSVCSITEVLTAGFAKRKRMQQADECGSACDEPADDARGGGNGAPPRRSVRSNFSPMSGSPTTPEEPSGSTRLNLKFSLLNGCQGEWLIPDALVPMPTVSVSLTQLVLGSSNSSAGHSESDDSSLRAMQITVPHCSHLGQQRAFVALQAAQALHVAAFNCRPVCCSVADSERTTGAAEAIAGSRRRLLLVTYAAAEDACALVDALLMFDASWGCIFDVAELGALEALHRVGLVWLVSRLGASNAAAARRALTPIMRAAVRAGLAVSDVVHLGTLPSAPVLSVEEGMGSIASVARLVAEIAEGANPIPNELTLQPLLSLPMPRSSSAGSGNSDDVPLTLLLPTSQLQRSVYRAVQLGAATYNVPVAIGCVKRCVADGLPTAHTSGCIAHRQQASGSDSALLTALASCVPTSASLLRHFAKPAVLKILLRSVATTSAIGGKVVAVCSDSTPPPRVAALLLAIGASSVDTGISSVGSWLRRSGRPSVLLLAANEVPAAVNAPESEVAVEAAAIAMVASVVVSLDADAQGAAGTLHRLRAAVGTADSAPLSLVHLRCGDADSPLESPALGTWDLGVVVEQRPPAAELLHSAIHQRGSTPYARSDDGGIVCSASVPTSAAALRNAPVALLRWSAELREVVAALSLMRTGGSELRLGDGAAPSREQLAALLGVLCATTERQGSEC